MKINFYTSFSCVVVIGLFCTVFPRNTLFAQSCPGLGSVTLTVMSAPVPTLSAPAQLCPDANGTVSVNQTFSGYEWNTGSFNQSTPITGPGIYTVTVTNVAGCTGTAMINVAPSPPPTPNITQNNYTCNGNIVLNAGNGYVSYAWSSGTNGQVAAFTMSGTYTVTVTNAQGCTGTDEFDVDIPPPPMADISGDLSICSGTNTTLSATAGYNVYTWNTGSHASSISVVNGGNYTVTVTDAFGCTDSASATVVSGQSPTPTVTNATLCAGNSVTLNVTNAPFQDYSWSNGGNSSSTQVTLPGNYTVTVTAVNGCTGSATATVAPLPSPSPIINPATYACNGQLVLNAGAGFPTYSWSTGSGTATTTVSVSGVYSVTVTNAQGCTGTDSFLADIPAPPAVTISGSNSFCQGTSNNLSATAGYNNYAWSNGQNGQNISITNGGVFTVTVTDGFGCTATNTFSVNSLPAPQPVIAGPASICAGTSATLNTSSSFPSYSWSNGENTSSITVTASGNYIVTVTASNGCTGTDSQGLAVTPAPSPAISASTYACDNQLLLNAGVGYNTYAWSNGSSLAGTSVTTSGTYTVTVTNAQGCTGTDVYDANIPVPPVVSITGANTICPGSSTDLTATAGFGSYVWSTGSFNAVLPVSAAGNYIVTVTDGFGCTATNSFSVSLLTAPNPNISGPSQICPTGSATFSVPGSFSAFSWSTGATTPTITVNTANTYTVTVTATNGCTAIDDQILVVANSLQPQITALPYSCNSQIILDAGTGFNTYNWGGGQSTQSITVNANGNYDVTVSDVGGCTGTAVITATIPPAPTVDITGTGSICTGNSTILNATPGLSAYLWSTGQVSDSTSVNAAGTYTVTATDALGCTVTDNFLLATTPLPQPAIAGPSIICTNSSGTLSLSGTFSQYNWSTGASTASITVISGNTYAVTVTDAQGCTGTTAQVVTEASSLSPTVTQQPYTCNGALTLDAGTGFSSYQWPGGANTATLQVTTTGSYTVTVSDATGCTGTGTLAVTVPTVPQVAITGQNSFCQNSSTSLAATPGFVSYSWSTGATTDTVTTAQSGTLTVTVTDNIGCTATETFSVTAQPLPQPQIAGPAAICAGNSSTFSLGQNFPAYAWSDGTTAASITATTAGPYSVTVTDANGCTGTADATLIVNSNPSPTIQEAAYACDGQITLTSTAGFNAYAWTGPGSFTTNGQQAIVLLSGNYAVVVTDANGCSGSVTQTVSVPALSQVLLNGPTQFCTGGSVDLTASAGFPDYAWSNGPTTAAVTVSTIGTYSVTATDALGCTSTAMMTLNNFPQPAPVIAGPQTVCPGSTATLSVGGSFTDYAWSSGANTANITVQPPFTGSVTVTDGNGCSGTATATVAVSNQLTPNIVQLPYACDGQVTLDAGAGFPNYTWSNTASTSTIQVSQSGSYTVTVSDGSGCSGTATIQVDVPVTQTVSVTGQSAICSGQSAALTASGGFVNYQWSNGQTGAGVSVNQTDTYVVTATDGNGCTSTASFVVGATPPLMPGIAGTNSICPGGSAVFSVSGNFAGYNWSTGANAASITVSQAGNYTVTVTDVAGCSGTATVTLTVGNGLTPSILQQPYACNGQITLDAGQGYASYLWSNGGNGQTVPAVQSGSYTVTVTDASGCSGTATTQVAIPPNPVVSISGTTSFCAGGGTALTASTGFSTYNWSNGSNLPSANITAAGSYIVTVTDAGGCTTTASATVQTLPTASVSITGGGTLCNGSSAALTTSGSTGTFGWSTGTTGTPLTVTQPGNYTVTVTDVNGCTATATATVTAGVPVTTTISRKSCRLAEAGTQILTLVAANGCDSIVTIITTYQPTIPGLALDLTPVIEAQTGQEVELQVTGNFPIDSVAFSSPFTLSCTNCLNPSWIATEAASILVMAFDVNGCNATGEVQVVIRKRLDVYVPNIFQPGSVDNGFFTVFSGSDITAVRNFSVYDRWGNALFSRPDMPTNDPTTGWDGTFRNRTMQPGVYVYYFEVFLPDGSKEVYSGGVTIAQ